jgi:peptide/nickel transport system permease protein
VTSIRSIAGSAILVLAAAMAIAGAMLAPEAYLRIGLAARFVGPDMAHWLGRDELGRDTLSRLLAGATTTISETLAVVAVALCVGLLLDRARRAFPRLGGALVALARICFIVPGFLLGPSRVGNVTMAALSAVLSLPGFLAAIAAVAVFGPGPLSGIIALGLPFAVAVAYAQPATPFAALAAKLLAWAMLSLSALDAIGLGTMPPKPSWGTMLGGLNSLASLHAPVIFSAACLVLAATGALMLAGALTSPPASPSRSGAPAPTNRCQAEDAATGP